MSNKYYFQGSEYDKEARDKYFKKKINRSAKKCSNCVYAVFIAFVFMFIAMFIPLFGLLFLFPAIIAVFVGSLVALKHSRDVDKYTKEQKQELANQLEYYRDSILDYGIFNVVAMFDEVSLRQDERSVLAGIIIYFLHKGILEETSSGYKVVNRPCCIEEARFVDFLLPTGEDTKEGIKERMTQAGNNIFEYIEPTLVKDGYLIPYNPHADFVEDLSPNSLKRKLADFAKDLEEKYKNNHESIDLRTNQSGVVKYYKFSSKGEQMANEILGSYRFFRDFTIINERGKVEIGLWEDYLVMATIYNMAEKVEIDLEDIMPEWRNFQYE